MWEERFNRDNVDKHGQIFEYFLAAVMCLLFFNTGKRDFNVEGPYHYSNTLPTVVHGQTYHYNL